MVWVSVSDDEAVQLFLSCSMMIAAMQMIPQDSLVREARAELR